MTSVASNEIFTYLQVAKAACVGRRPLEHIAPLETSTLGLVHVQLPTICAPCFTENSPATEKGPCRKRCTLSRMAALSVPPPRGKRLNDKGPHPSSSKGVDATLPPNGACSNTSLTLKVQVPLLVGFALRRLSICPSSRPMRLEVSFRNVASCFSASSATRRSLRCSAVLSSSLFSTAVRNVASVLSSCSSCLSAVLSSSLLSAAFRWVVSSANFLSRIWAWSSAFSRRCCWASSGRIRSPQIPHPLKLSGQISSWAPRSLRLTFAPHPRGQSTVWSGHSPRCLERSAP
mmetsp:Transcript_15997/g.48022  ORF Transcript_15997/g.48022 Transcript_15997/m.48022 type:complete len:289 (+) Transcript_15997:268-1134(+)